jgi:chemotaxis protein methyltransferase CheR
VRHFRKQGDVWQLSDDIRRMVDFRRLNLNDSWPELASQDVIFLRNVLIYFDVATKKHILGKIRRVLRPDGCLFLGGGETTLNLDLAFERRPYERGCCYGLAAGARLAE